MATTSTVDVSTLGWVKNEIDETLKQARQSLESYVENPSDDSQLRFCITHLHQVVGTLEMVELDGAALLARETEALAEAILQEDVEANDHAYDILTRGILTLPDYLARLQFGQQDVPLRLLPLLNELRTVRNSSPISELELFKPDLTIRPPRKSRDKTLSQEEYSAMTKQLRSAFQVALLAWLRDTGSKEALSNMLEILQKLEEEANLSIVEQLFWVASGLLEGMIAGDLEPTNERKKLLSRLDQHLRKLVDGAGKIDLRSSIEDLIKSILFEIGQAKSANPKVALLKRAFNLDALLGRSEEAAGEETAILPTPEVLHSVSEALSQEITDAQDILAGFFDPDQEDVDSLAPLRILLDKMSGTMEMLNVPMLKALIEALSAVSVEVDEGRLESGETLSMVMARALLLVESSARDISHSAAEWKRQIEEITVMLQNMAATDELPSIEGLEVSDAELSESDYRQLLNVVADEIRVNLTNIEEFIETFVGNTAQLDQLDQVGQHLHQIQGALQILGQDGTAMLADKTIDYVEDIGNGVLTPDNMVMDSLAVSVGTIGAYIDGLQFNRPNLHSLIDLALTDLGKAISERANYAINPQVLATRIESDLESWLTYRENAAVYNLLRYRLELVETIAAEQGQEKIGKISQEIQNLLQIVMDDPSQLTDEIVEALKKSSATLVEMTNQKLKSVRPSNVVSMESAVSQKAADVPPIPEPEPAAEPIETIVEESRGEPEPAEPMPPETPPTAAGGEEDDNFDEEIMEIFVEDARDSLNTINKNYPAWQQNNDNVEAMLEVRRAFHTIKGSGRMVGASQIAELAWAVENMLNKVRDRRIPLTDDIVAHVDRVRQVLPELIAHLDGGPAPTADVATLQSRAHALAEGIAVAAQPTIAEGQAAPVEVESAEELLKLDATLLQIFTVEALGHIKTIGDELADCERAGGCYATRGLIRATHTLSGSARSVGLTPMSDACKEMEKLLQDMETHQRILNAQHVALLEETEKAVSELVQSLLDTGQPTRALYARLEEIAARARQAHTQIPQMTEVHSRDDDLFVMPAEPPAMPVEPPVAAAPFVAPPVKAAPVKQEQVTKTRSRIQDNVDPDLADIFYEEAVDILQTINDALADWRRNPDNGAAVQDLKRALHTLKGGARMSGVMSLGELAHDTETMLGKVEQKTITADNALRELLDEIHDTLAAAIELVRDGKPVSGIEGVSERLRKLIDGRSLSSPAAPAVTPTPPAVSQSARPAATPKEEHAGTTPIVEEVPELGEHLSTHYDRRHEDREDVEELMDDGRAPEKTDRREQIRVRTDLLNTLANYAGEVSISRSRMEQQIFGFRENLGEMNRSVVRFRDQLRELEIQSESQILYRAETQGVDDVSDFDPLEFDRFSKLQQLSRGLTESLHDLGTIQGNLRNFASEAEAVLQQQARVNTDLQEGLMRTRMIDFNTQAARLRHIVRQTSRELNKQAQLEIIGAGVEVDRNVLERMIGPFEHMIRNALDHGIESQAERKRAGKPAMGKITIENKHEGSEVVLRLSDDGKGLDIGRIRKKAIERGLMTADANLSEEEIMQFILVSGFSTASTVTQISGRGVGMDVVHNEVRQLGGSMAVDTQMGAGTTFTIRLPLTLSIAQALMIYVGDQMYALPLSSVVNILEVPMTELRNIYMGDKPLLKHNDRVYPFMNLAAYLGVSSSISTATKTPILLARSGSREVAMQVDGLAGTREIVIKPLGPQLSDVSGLSGATILGDGRVVLILDVPGLWLTEEVMHVSHSISPAAARPVAKQVRERPVIMVVDDSLTVRKITTKFLQKRGMEVLTAKDGLDAVEQLREHIPDLMLVDIEMPRMDGYELTKRVRSDNSLQHIPIIMITSRAGSKHKEKAMDLGVNVYMSKPYQEDELAQAIKDLLD